LDRSSAARVVESELVGNEGEGTTNVDDGVTKQLVEALGVLRAQGYDLNEIVDRKDILLGNVVQRRDEGEG
jgi:hypothetical protein